MENKKEFTIEELKKMYEDALKESNTIGEMLRQKEEDEEDRRKAQLALEKENRKKEVDEAFNKYNELVKAYIKDYGSYSTASYTNDFWFLNKFWPSFF